MGVLGDSRSLAFETESTCPVSLHPSAGSLLGAGLLLSWAFLVMLSPGSPREGEKGESKQSLFFCSQTFSSRPRGESAVLKVTHTRSFAVFGPKPLCVVLINLLLCRPSSLLLLTETKKHAVLRKGLEPTPYEGGGSAEWKGPDLATALTPVPMWTLPSDTLLWGALVVFAELLGCKARVMLMLPFRAAIRMRDGTFKYLK